jgi:hypothetical protein
MSTRKLGADGRDLLARLREERASASAHVSVLLRGKSTFSASELKTLTDDGAQIRTQAGDILSADVPVEAVDRVLAHDFIVSCELSRPLYYDAGGRASKADVENERPPSKADVE